MRFRMLASGFVLLFLNVITIFTPSGMAKSSNLMKVNQFKNFFVNLPWWAYLLIAFVLLLVFLWIVFQRFSRRKQKQTKDPSHSLDPVTVRPVVHKVTPGNAQYIGSRSEQQDAFGFSDIGDDSFMEQFGVLVVLADGMGGLRGGKEASHLAVTSFLDHYLHTPFIASIPEKLLSAVQVANDAVLQFASDNGLRGSVGTTSIAAALHQNKLYWLSVGDSRIYLKQREGLTQLTNDHIYANKLDEKVALGEITKEEAENDLQRESLTSFLGLDLLEEVGVSMEPIPLYKGDTVLLCSDGLYGSITSTEILRVCHSLSTQEAAEELIGMVLRKQKPNQDNATVALLTVG